MSQPSTSTHGLKAGGFTCQLNGVPLGASSTHDHLKAVDRVPISSGDGAGTRPLTMPAHSNEVLRIFVALEEIPDAQFREFQAVVDQASRGVSIEYSPLGETTYTSSGWTLLSTTAEWVETRYGVWAGPVELLKKGAALYA